MRVHECIIIILEKEQGRELVNQGMGIMPSPGLHKKGHLTVPWQRPQGHAI